MLTAGPIETKIENMATFGTIANKAVVVVGAPSYTSGAHIWNGAADSLNNSAIVISRPPIGGMAPPGV